MSKREASVAICEGIAVRMNGAAKQEVGARLPAYAEPLAFKPAPFK